MQTLILSSSPSPAFYYMMGICISTQGGAKKVMSDAIDGQHKEDSRKLHKECRILLLGSGESGKSTIAKQLKILHQNGFTDEELMSYRPAIYQNTLESAQAVLLAMRKIGLSCVDLNNRLNEDCIFDYRFDLNSPFEFSPIVALAIYELWKDPIIPELMACNSKFYLMDNAAYFFSEALRIGAPNYLPTEGDVLRVRLKTKGIIETRLTMGQLRYVTSFHSPRLISVPSRVHMFDAGGQRSERRKWIHCFEGVTSIVFCTALSEYDQVLLEEQNQNRMAESLALFESVVNSWWFSRTSVILLLNKIDVFKAKLPKVCISRQSIPCFLMSCQVPLEYYFPDYSGGANINKAAKYILWRFMRTNRACLSVYPCLTQATDTTNVHLVFSAAKETILQNSLKDSGVL
ncbi:guanine nucleotide binding protein, alpha subunit [Chiua virens]|nr:guanine nucleotide binding protein, alpha subunit [Chiua virens]